MNKQLIKKIDAVLPQTQCGQCGFVGCEPYATAIVEGQADINQCPPGDKAGIRKIAAILGVQPKPLNTRHGLPKPRAIAVIDENLCIGCTFCIRACPVDAIVGAAKQMHTVIQDECTGCELCVAPCPMDCIAMVPVVHSAENPDIIAAQAKEKADRARLRYQYRQQRLAQGKKRTKQKNNPVLQDKPKQLDTPPKENHTDHRKKAIVQAALQRAAAMRAQASK